MCVWQNGLCGFVGLESIMISGYIWSVSDFTVNDEVSGSIERNNIIIFPIEISPLLSINKIGELVFQSVLCNKSLISLISDEYVDNKLPKSARPKEKRQKWLCIQAIDLNQDSLLNEIPILLPFRATIYKLKPNLSHRRPMITRH